LAFQFHPGESVPRGIRRVVVEQLEFAAAQLHKPERSARVEAVHEARKSIKKVRAILRLMADELDLVALTGNTLLRDLGRKLSAERDAAVLVDTLDSLKDEDDKSPELARLRSRLVRERSRAARAESPTAVAFALERAAERVRTWPLHATGFAALAPGLHESFHRGRKAMANARKDSTSENFHEWRKRVKDHWYHMRLLEGIWTDATRSYEKGLKDLENCLGDDHNIAVLVERVASLDNVAEFTDLLASAHHRQKHLRHHSLNVGERLYAQKPCEFIRHMERLWNASQPGGKKPGTQAA